LSEEPRFLIGLRSREPEKYPQIVHKTHAPISLYGGTHEGFKQEGR